SCTGGSLSGAVLTLNPSETASCSITNTSQLAHLTLTKTVDNTNGGSKAISDFPLTATGSTTITGVFTAATVTNAAVKAGSYTLSETTVSGYNASAWICTGGSLSGAVVTLNPGDTAICSITNTSQLARLTLSKTVDITNGGNKTITDFPLTGTGPTIITGVSATAAVTNAAVKAGSYSLSETTVNGYSASAWSCTGGSLSGAVLTLNPSDTASCSITNTSQLAHLT